MAKRRQRRAKGLGSVYRIGQSWSIRWTHKGTRHSQHGFPDEDIARRALAVKIGDIAAGRAGLTQAKPSGRLTQLADAWLQSRKVTHRSADQDGYRWRNHLAPTVGKYAPDDVDVGMLKRLITAKLTEGLAPATVRLLVRLLSTFYSDLIDDGKATKNPARMLPKATRKLYRPTYDPKKTPFVERREDVARLFRALPEPINIAYAISALAGLRPGEVRSLKWTNVDLPGRRIYVRESVNGPTKDKDAREAPVVPSLQELLMHWKVNHPNPHHGLVCPPMRGATRRFLDEHTVGKFIRAACKTVKLPELTFYEAGRHTFASQWVLSGGSIEKLREILGHSTVLVTERYAHLKPELFQEADLLRADIPLTAVTSDRPRRSAGRVTR